MQHKNILWPSRSTQTTKRLCYDIWLNHWSHTPLPEISWKSSAKIHILTSYTAHPTTKNLRYAKSYFKLNFDKINSVDANCDASDKFCRHSQPSTLLSFGQYSVLHNVEQSHALSLHNNASRSLKSIITCRTSHLLYTRELRAPYLTLCLLQQLWQPAPGLLSELVVQVN